MRTISRLLVMVVMVGSAPLWAAGGVLPGIGTEGDPYLIEDLADFDAFADSVNAATYWASGVYTRLACDPNLAGSTYTSAVIAPDMDNTNYPWVFDGPPFSGVFDGDDHVIRNLTIDTAGEDNDYLGLFGMIEDSSAEVKNLGIENVNITGGDDSSYLGGLCGSNGDWANPGGTITNCYSSGSVTGGENSRVLGGLCGINDYGTITNCYSGGSVTGDRVLGGLCGSNSSFSTISNCYSGGSVTGYSYLGGLCGANSVSTISNCYATGSVTGDRDLGGLCGNIRSGTIANCFWDIETGGPDNGLGTPLPTEQMQTLSTFIDAGWDFAGETVNGIEDIWFIPQGDYPHLWWEGLEVSMKLTPRTLNCRSQGNWVKAHLTLPEGFTVEDVDGGRPAVLRYFGFESAALDVFVNPEGLVEIEAAFRREDICSLANDWPDSLSVYGFFSDGSMFLGISTVRIITPGLKDIDELAARWLEMDCSHPHWCGGMDLNRDSLVNLADFALIQSSEIEFVSK